MVQAMSRTVSTTWASVTASSSLVAPARWPPSTWDWITQRRTGSFRTPSCSATTAAAAVSEAYPPLVFVDQPYRLAFNSSSIFFGMVLILLDSNRSGIKPWALHQFKGVPSMWARPCW